MFVSLLVMWFHFAFDNGPQDTEPHTLITVECENNVEAEIYRKKQLNLTTTEIGILIKKENQIILRENLNSADLWSDITDSKIELKCTQNTINTSLKYYFDRVYIINNDSSIRKINNLSN